MKNKLKAYGIYLPVFLIMLIATVTLRTVGYLRHLDTSSGYLTNPLIANISAWMVAGTVLFLLSYLFVASRENKLIPSFASPFNYIPCALVGTSLIFLGVDTLMTAKGNVFAIAVGILSLLSIGYFAASAISVKRGSIRRSDLGLVVLIFICVYVAYIYFDNNTPLNNPQKIADEVAFLSAALFFLYETRLSLGRERWRAYIAFGFIAALLSAYSAIPALIIYLARGTLISLSFYQLIFSLTVFIFALFKLLLVSALVPERQSDIVDKIIKYSDERTERINEALDDSAECEEETEEDENQMSIADIDVESEIIDAPDVEEGFLLEQELPTTEELAAEPTVDTYTEDGINEALLREETETKKDDPTE